jgi:hypothetical protein
MPPRVTGVSGVLTFLRAKTTVDPTKPRASSLVTWGVYGISRNPMYSGGLISISASEPKTVDMRHSVIVNYNSETLLDLPEAIESSWPEHRKWPPQGG